MVSVLAQAATGVTDDGLKSIALGIVAALGLLTFPLAFVFFILEVGLIATLQAFIFSTLTAIYLGGAVAEEH
jgi:F-type H+-transporting ATPase subunit a